MLRKYHPLFINTHFNHPKELTPPARAACERLADAGIPLGNQTVLLRGRELVGAAAAQAVHRLSALPRPPVLPVPGRRAADRRTCAPRSRPASRSCSSCAATSRAWRPAPGDRHAGRHGQGDRPRLRLGARPTSGRCATTRTRWSRTSSRRSATAAVRTKTHANRRLRLGSAAGGDAAGRGGRARGRGALWARRGGAGARASADGARGRGCGGARGAGGGNRADRRRGRAGRRRRRVAGGDCGRARRGAAGVGAGGGRGPGAWAPSRA